MGVYTKMQRNNSTCKKINLTSDVLVFTHIYGTVYHLFMSLPLLRTGLSGGEEVEKTFHKLKYFVAA
jgi:hypothetical protein